MSGLAGWIAPPGKGPDESAVATMLEALAHRGVPGEELVGVADRNTKRHAVLGATLCDKPSRISVALDGAIANARELRAELERRGHAFKLGSGAELVLRAYQRWDKDVARHLRGAFSFAVWD